MTIFALLTKMADLYTYVRICVLLSGKWENDKCSLWPLLVVMQVVFHEGNALCWTPEDGIVFARCVI
jgi:hypothetical protein